LSDLLGLSAPKARNAKAWGIAPGKCRQLLLALKARNFPSGKQNFVGNRIYPRSSLSRLQRFLPQVTCPGALPQAFAFRAFGALLRLAIQTCGYNIT
jgi:hypothetical protein